MVYNTRTFALAENYFTNNAIPDVNTSNIPDNIDEAVSTILYETEINYNRLMNISGVFGSGFVNEEVVTEAVDLKGFFAKVKTFFKNLLEKIAKLFKKIMEKAKEFFKNIFSKNKKSNTNGNNSSAQKNNASTNDKEDDNSSDEHDRSSGTKMLGYTKNDILALPQKEYNDITYKGYNYTHLTEGTSEIDTDKIKKIISSYVSWQRKKVYENIKNRNIYSQETYEKLPELRNKLNETSLYLSSSNIRNKIQNEIYSIILNTPSFSLKDSETWERKLYTYFRDDQETPVDILMKSSDISKYQEKLKSGEDSIQQRLKHTYNQAESDIKNRLEELRNPSEYLNHEDESDFEGAIENFELELGYQRVNFNIYWLKQTLNWITQFTVAQTNAIMEQCRQYRTALIKIQNQ